MLDQLRVVRLFNIYLFMPLLQIRGSDGFFFRAFAHCNKSDRPRVRDGIDKLGSLPKMTADRVIVTQLVKRTVSFESEARKEAQTLPRRQQLLRYPIETAKADAAIPK